MHRILVAINPKFRKCHMYSDCSIYTVLLCVGNGNRECYPNHYFILVVHF